MQAVELRLAGLEAVDDVWVELGTAATADLLGRKARYLFGPARR